MCISVKCCSVYLHHCLVGDDSVSGASLLDSDTLWRSGRLTADFCGDDMGDAAGLTPIREGLDEGEDVDEESGSAGAPISTKSRMTSF
jgi:hypothetical protein